MVANALVVFPIETGAKLVEALDRDGFDVRAAFWYPWGETGRWRLHIASPLVDKAGPRAAYARIQSALSSLRTKENLVADPVQALENLSLEDVTVLSPKSEKVRQMRNLAVIHKGEPAKWVPLEQAFVYRTL